LRNAFGGHVLSIPRRCVFSIILLIIIIVIVVALLGGFGFSRR